MSRDQGVTTGGVWVYNSSIMEGIQTSLPVGNVRRCINYCRYHGIDGGHIEIVKCRNSLRSLPCGSRMRRTSTCTLEQHTREVRDFTSIASAVYLLSAGIRTGLMHGKQLPHGTAGGPFGLGSCYHRCMR